MEKMMVRLSVCVRVYQCLRNVVFDVADVFALVDKLDNKFTLSPDGVSNIFSKRHAAQLVLSFKYKKFKKSFN